jgi:hypothetical protein
MTFFAEAQTLRDPFGTSLANLGDTNRDGHDDLLVASPGDSGGGYLHIYAGRSGQRLLRIAGSNPVDRFGNSVAAGGDVNGDGHADLLVTLPGPSPSQAYVGRVQARSGRTGELLIEWPAPVTGSVFGRSLASGDFNGDGTMDALIGAPDDNSVAYAGGSVHAYSTRRLAIVQPVGTGCGEGPLPPLLRSAPPVLGRPCDLAIALVAPRRAGLLLSSPGDPRQPGVPCGIQVDVGQMLLLGVLTSDALGTSTTRLPIPADSLLNGAPLTLQAVFLPTAGPLGVDLTHGLFWVLGG